MKKLIKIATVPESLLILQKDQLRFLNKYYNVIAIASSGDYLKMVEKQEAVRTINVDMYRRFSPLRDLLSIYRMYKVLKREKPYIIHSITPKAGFVSMIAGFIARVPHRIHTFTGLVFPSHKGFLRYLLLNIDRIICLMATIIIPEGEGVRRDLVKNKVTRKKLEIIANGNVNGVNLDYFKSDISLTKIISQYQHQFEIQKDDTVFIFVGRIVVDKGIEELTSAFMSLCSEVNIVKLIIIGPYEKTYDPISKDTQRAISSHPKIKYLGYQKDIRPFLGLSHILVLPSYREGFPNVVLQAGAMDLPCIVTDINGSNEIIVDGINGLIVPTKNILKLFDAMKRLALNPLERNRMASVSRRMIVERYDQRLVWNELLKKYNSLN